VPSALAADGTEIHYLTRGDETRPTIYLGPHCYASSVEGEPRTPHDPTRGWIDALADAFHLIVADNPRGMGATGNPLGLGYSPDIAVADFEAILDAAGVDRVGWVGYSYGGAYGVQVACRSDRLAAVAIGGWPPLHAPFARLVELTTETASNPTPELAGNPDLLWASVGFYTPLTTWPERQNVERLELPRLAFMGTGDEVGPPGPTLSDLLRRAEPELVELGWEIAWIEGADHLGAQPAEASAGAVRAFFERALNGGGG
jgi:pimeloyl-ACP methyl ester carboxylesterase